MNVPVEIVLAERNDIETVRYITQTTITDIYPHYYPSGAVQFFRKHHSDDRIADDLAERKVYLLRGDGQAVGTVTINENGINRLFVLPVYQRKGYGKILLDFAESKIAEQYDTVLVDASLPAKAIYKKRGYAETEYYIIETENGDMLCYDVMKLEF